MLQFGKIAIVGAGNTAYTLCKILKNKGIEPYCMYVRDVRKVDKVRDELHVDVVSDYKKVVKSDLTIIAVNDDSISDVALHLVDYKGLVVHTSGTKPSDVLSALTRYGVFYPLQTMSKNREIEFEEVPMLVYSNSKEDTTRLLEFASLFSKKVFECDDAQRKAIHLAAVFVSNFTNVMIGIGDKLLKDKSMSVAIMENLVKEMMKKCFDTSPRKAITGPAKRKDYATIEEHEKMLSNYPEEKEIYKILTKYIIENYNNNEEL